MKKLLISGLLFLSINSLSASADHYMNRYISRENRNYLIAGDFITEYNNGLKAMALAKFEAYYDMSMSSYLKSFFVDTKESHTIKIIKETEAQIKDRLSAIQNNTWEQWGWSAVKYSAVIATTYYLTKLSLTPQAHS